MPSECTCWLKNISYCPEKKGEVCTVKAKHEAAERKRLFWLEYKRRKRKEDPHDVQLLVKYALFQ